MHTHTHITASTCTQPPPPLPPPPHTHAYTQRAAAPKRASTQARTGQHISATLFHSSTSIFSTRTCTGQHVLRHYPRGRGHPSPPSHDVCGIPRYVAATTYTTLKRSLPPHPPPTHTHSAAISHASDSHATPPDSHAPPPDSHAPPHQKRNALTRSPLAHTYTPSHTHTHMCTVHTRASTVARTHACTHTHKYTHTYTKYACTQTHICCTSHLLRQMPASKPCLLLSMLRQWPLPLGAACTERASARWCTWPLLRAWMPRWGSS